MSAQAPARAREPARRETGVAPIRWTLSQIWNVLGLALIGLLLSLVLEYVGLVFWWAEEGADHAMRMLEGELAYLNADFASSVTGAAPVEVAVTISTALYRYSGLQWLVRALTTPPATAYGLLNDALLTAQAFVAPAGEFIAATVYIVQLYGVRIAVVVLSLPVFVLFGVVGLVDGLVQRDLRRFHGGTESAFIYHHLKRWLTPIVSLSALGYLSLPFSLHPNLVFIPAAFLFAFIGASTAARFKKFL